MPHPQQVFSLRKSPDFTGLSCTKRFLEQLRSTVANCAPMLYFARVIQWTPTGYWLFSAVSGEFPMIDVWPPSCFIFFQQPKSYLLPETGRGGTEFPGHTGPGTGRTVRGDARQGHFQGQARQLTSPAFGRAILQPRGVHGCQALPNRNNCSFGARRLIDAGFTVWQTLMLAADSRRL
jgi:hypothetical protein